MAYFTIKQCSIFYSFPMDVKEQRKLDVFLTVLESSGVGPIIASSVFGDGHNVGKKPYDPYRMFAFIVLAFSLKKMTLRDIEDFGRHDLRARYVLGSDLPSYKTIGQYINEVIFPNMETIFHRITSAIAAYCKIEDVFSVAFIDGTKLEADANKYKFVWKPDKRMEKLKATIMSLLSVIGIAVKETEINSMALLGWMNAYMSERKLDSVPVPAKGKRLTNEEKTVVGLQKCLVKLLEYEEIIETCGPDRNSYYRTDHDATAMSLKRDYYSGHGSNFHAAYNVQFSENYGLITNFGCYQNRADYHTLIPFLERFRHMNGKYPGAVVADSGYGIETNYSFMKDNGIKAFVKFQSWEGEAKGERPQLFFLDSNDSITCLNGKKAEPIRSESRHVRRKGNLQYLVDGCMDCEFAYMCRKNLKHKNDGKRFVELNPSYERLKDEARKLLLSPEGIRMRILRSIQSEGVFGIMKEDMSKVRFKRTGIRKAELEMMLFSCGFNVRKLFSFISGNTNALVKYELPEDTPGEEFPKVKPSKKKSEKMESKKAVRTAPLEESIS